MTLTSCGSSKPYRVFESPDKKHRIVVISTSLFGSGRSDQPGTFQLEDATGKVLQKQDIEMVQMVDRVEWKPDEVDVRPHAVWKITP